MTTDPVRLATPPAAEPPDAARGTARGGAANLLGSAVSATAQLAAVLVVTRAAGQDTAGSLFAGVSVLLIAAALAQLGTDVSLVRHVSLCSAHARRQDAVTVVRGAVLAVAAGSALLVTALSATPDGWLTGVLGGADATSTAVLVLGVPLLALHELLLAVTRGTGTMRPTVVLERIARPLLQVVALVTAATLAGGPAALAVAWVAPWALVLPLSALAAARALRGIPSGGDVVPATRRAAFWRFSATRAVARTCQVALQRADIILVAAIAGASAAAVYTAATRFMVLGQVVAAAVQQAAQPHFARLHTTGERSALQDLLRRTTVWSVALVWPPYLLMGLCAPWLLRPFGEGYEAGATVLVLLAAAMLVASAAGPVDVVLLMSGRGGTSLAITAAALAVDIALCLVLIPPLGLTGAAVAWAVAIVLRNAASVWAVRRSLRIGAGSPQLVRVAAQSLLAVGVPTGVTVAAGGTGYVLLTVVCVAGVTHLALLWRDRDRYDLALLARR